jgi:23S rRNA (adenine2503-C2)-methyltransferase
MPLNRKVGVAEVFSALNGPLRAIRGRLTVEYVLIGGVNDWPDQADELARKLKPDRKLRINLIRYNEAGIEGFGPPTEQAVLDFQQRLIAKGHKAFVRRPLGRDISAACGQLAAKSSSE